MKAIRKLLKAIGRSRSGNAALLVGAGMPMIIGGTGLAVDTAQWYLWKRELQYAADQAAIAGAWALSVDDDGATYISRAEQEYEANMDTMQAFDTDPVIGLGDFGGETDNSVVVTASITRTLPFSSFLTNEGVTVGVRAEAIYDPAPEWRPCLLALDPDSDKTLEFKGGPTVDAGCGVGALSDGDSAIWINSTSGSYELGYVVTAGKLDDAHGKFGDDDNTFEEQSGLKDPWEGLTPPEDETDRSLSCPKATGDWTATQTSVSSFSYTYWKGANTKNLEAYDYESPRAPWTGEPIVASLTFAAQPADTTSISSMFTEVAGGGNKKIYEKETKTTKLTYKDVVAPATAATDMMQPGTYTEFVISCDTQLAPGIYVLDGTNLKITSSHTLTGHDIMFVLKNGAGIEVSGQAKLNLTGISKAKLIEYDATEEDAARMEGMVIFEHPDSDGTAKASLTGGGDSVINGIIYMPKSTLSVSGNPRGVSDCLQIAAGKMKFSGDTNLTTLCPSGMTPRGSILDARSMVRLVG